MVDVVVVYVILLPYMRGLFGLVKNKEKSVISYKQTLKGSLRFSFSFKLKCKQLLNATSQNVVVVATVVAAISYDYICHK